MTKKKTKGPGDSWQVRGVTQEARNAAKMAARRCNEFVGAWVCRNILEAAQRDLGAKREVARPEDLHDTLKKMNDRLEQLAAKIEQRENSKSWFGNWIRKS